MSRRYFDYDALTERELGILIMLADGMTYAAISKELFVSISTLNVHRKHIFRKLGALTSAHAVALAYHKRILKIPGVVY
jgi:two-component system response regulator NreC